MSTVETKPASTFDQWVVGVIERFGGQLRAPQMEMIGHVVEAIRSNEPVIIEATTGVGKTGAYCIPAIFANRTMGKRVLIVTRTKKLQDQLAKDLPRFIDAALGDNAGKVKWATLKGRNHFTCKKRITKSDAVIPVSLSAWAMNGGGSKDDAPEHLDKEWRAVSGGQDCVGKKCPFFEECPGTSQREYAAQADIVIANQALLAMNVAFDIEAIPGTFDIVIIDEAQHLENTIREQLSNNLTPFDLTKATWADAADIVTNLLPEQGYVFHPGVVPGSPLYKVWVHAIREKKVLKMNMEADETPDLEDKKMLNLLTKIVDTLGAFTRPDENILWVDSDGMHSSPVDVKELIRDSFSNKTTVFTSATIPDSFGMDKPVVAIEGGYTNAGLYISDISGAGKYEFRPDAAQETLEMVQAVGGRSLLLYTSEIAMMEMYHWLRTRLDVPVYHQKMSNSVDNFRNIENSVLLGIESMWEGLDVAGPSLSLVIIDRLPFPNMGDPLYVADVERHGWAKASLPPTTTMLRQGVGRLLRSPDDVGVVAVLDCRLKTKNYGKVLTKNIKMQFIPDKNTAVKFLKQIRDDIESGI